MKIIIYIYDKNKPENFYKKAMAEYQKRLGRYCNISSHLIRKEKPWKKLLEEKRNGYCVIPGESISSEHFSEHIANWELSGQKEIIFYIADKENFSEEFLPLHQLFSLSKYDINPQMSGLILYEQIYRGYRILNNHPYHK